MIASDAGCKWAGKYSVGRGTASLSIIVGLED